MVVLKGQEGTGLTLGLKVKKITKMQQIYISAGLIARIFGTGLCDAKYINCKILVNAYYVFPHFLHMHFKSQTTVEENPNCASPLLLNFSAYWKAEF